MSTLFSTTPNVPFQNMTSYLSINSASSTIDCIPMSKKYSSSSKFETVLYFGVIDMSLLDNPSVIKYISALLDFISLIYFVYFSFFNMLLIFPPAI